MSEPLHLKYRPKTFEEVIGQETVIKSLKTMLASETVPHTFLLTGNSGTGKTTLARIVASHFDYDVVEVDVASQNSAESARELVERLDQNSLFSQKGKFIILDEAHVATKLFFNVLLKTLEEPPPRTAFALCTTEKGKIPSTIVTRCTQLNLLDVPVSLLHPYLEEIAKKEGYRLPSGATKQIALASKGSVRQSLVYLSSCRTATSLDDIAILLENEAVDEDSFQTVRLLASNGTPVQIMGKLKTLQEKGINPTQLQAMMRSYFLKMLLNAKSNQEVFKLTEIVDRLINPIYEWPQLIVSVGQILIIKNNS